MTESEIKCTHCPECGCSEFVHEDEIGEGFRVCTECNQEWWTDINYDLPAGEQMTDTLLFCLFLIIFIPAYAAFIKWWWRNQND